MEPTTGNLTVAVRRELGRQGRRAALPLIAMLLLVAVLATDRPDQQVDAAALAGPEAGATTGLASTPPPGQRNGPTTPAGGPGASGEGVTTTVPFDSGAAPAPTPVTEPDGPDSTAPPGGGEQAAAPGTSRTGVVCDGRNRQLPESDYGPLCVPEFSGDNGGKTAYGVTEDEIVVTYRISGSAQAGALQALGGSELESVGLDQEGIANDMAVLVDYFNERFELYGRRVRFVVYEGQGDILEEYQGRNQQGAQADAARAKDLGAFADVSYAGQSQLYAEAAASLGIVVYSPIYLTREWHQARAPFSHSAYWPPTEDGAQFQVNVVCGALRGKKAERSNDPTVAAQDRSFGIIHPENPEYARIGELVERGLKDCGANFERRVSYALDVSQGAQQATNAMAQMRAEGVTSILCVCDFLFPQLLMQNANQQQYVPEWFLTFHWSDPFYRTYPENQFSGQLVAGGVTEPFLDTEPGQVFRAATGGGEPESVYTYDKVYQQIHLLFSGLQATGPNLTPASMWQAMQRLPITREGAVGPWEFGAGPSMPRRWYPLGVYDPNGRNSIDDRPGASVACFGGRYFRFDDAAALDGPLDCPL